MSEVRQPVQRRVVQVGQAGQAPQRGAVPQHRAPPPAGLKAREGDVLYVSYPGVKVPTKKQYLSVEVGGLSIQRQMREGEDFLEAYEELYGALRTVAERDAVAKRDFYVKEFDNLNSAGGK